MCGATTNRSLGFDGRRGLILAAVWSHGRRSRRTHPVPGRSLGVKHLDPTIMPPEHCIEMATINAAQAIGLDGEIGSLESGKLADIAIFDLNTPHSSPATNPIASLVYSARGPDVHTVFVNGREVVSNHKLTTFGDTNSLFARARTRAQEIVTKAGLSDRAKSVWLQPAYTATEKAVVS